MTAITIEGQKINLPAVLYSTMNTKTHKISVCHTGELFSRKASQTLNAYFRLFNVG